jgi:hypothetical protein
MSKEGASSPAGLGKAALDALELTALRGYAGAEKFAELNLGAARELGDNLMRLSTALIQAKEPADVLTAQAAAAQMLVAIGATYGTRLFVLLNENMPEFVKVFEQRLAEYGPKLAPPANGRT